MSQAARIHASLEDGRIVCAATPARRRLLREAFRAPAGDRLWSNAKPFRMWLRIEHRSAYQGVTQRALVVCPRCLAAVRR